MVVKHTPGPWEPMWDFSGVTHRQQVIAKLDDLTDADEQEANAKLIASAPALLEALTLARDALHQADYDEIDDGKLEAHIRLTINAAAKGGDSDNIPGVYGPSDTIGGG